jgi:cyclophilin family peptidyl-prolyl cis-trans isomerase
MRSILLCTFLIGLFSCQEPKSRDLVADAQSSDSAVVVQSPWPTPPPSWPKVEIRTEKGSLFLALNPSVSQHTANFLRLVRSGYYEGLLFHRIIRDFMVQSGDPQSKGAQPDQSLGNGDPGYTLAAEFIDTLFHWRGALAMARQPDAVNPEKRSSGSQFYIVTGQAYPDEQMRLMHQQRYYNEFFQDPINVDYYKRWQLALNTGDQKALNALFDEVNAISGPEIDALHQRTPESARRIYSTWGGAPSLDGEYTIFGYLYDGYPTLDILNATQTANADRPVQDLHILEMNLLEEAPTAQP